MDYTDRYNPNHYPHHDTPGVCPRCGVPGDYSPRQFFEVEAHRVNSDGSTMLVPRRVCDECERNMGWEPWVLSCWRIVVELIASTKAWLAPLLREAALLAFGPEGVRLGYEDRSWPLVRASDVRSTVAAALREFFGCDLPVAFEVVPRVLDSIAIRDEPGILLERARRKAAEEAAERETAKIVRRERIVKRLGDVPPRYTDVRFSADIGPRVRRARAVEEARAAIGASMVVLVGPAGAGKTTLASAIYHELIDRALSDDPVSLKLAKTATWIAAPDLARARRAHPLGQGEPPLVEEAMSASFLVIDDVGQETKNRDGDVREVLWHRSEQELPTVVTTGRSSAELVELYGAGVGRRLTDRNMVTVILCSDPKADKRLEARAS